MGLPRATPLCIVGSLARTALAIVDSQHVGSSLCLLLNVLLVAAAVRFRSALAPTLNDSAADNPLSANRLERVWGMLCVLLVVLWVRSYGDAQLERKIW